jgi:aldehyde dehydrogenase (NAD+)
VREPLGVVVRIVAVNHPFMFTAGKMAAPLAAGNAVIIKPPEQAPLSALRLAEIIGDMLPPGVISILPGGREAGAALAADRRIPLVSATGSVAMGRAVARTVGERLGRSLLELGGNAATIVCPSADLDLAVRAIAFGAAGTTGQRCTTMRRLIVHESVYDALVPRLKKVFASLRIGDPREPDMLVGPMIDETAVAAMQAALDRARAEGGEVSGGEALGGCYVRPALAEMPAQTDLVREETFAPILYVLRYRDFDEAIALQRDVPQGLSSSILTNDMREAEAFLSATGSDCGIANVNMGTSGAEIGGAFGGEKETGGGRESGSDAWMAYMRRQTQNVNYGRSLPLAQGVEFDF